MENVTFYIEEETVVKKVLVINNNNEEDKLLSINIRGELAKIVIIKKYEEKKIHFNDVNLEDIQIEEIKG